MGILATSGNLALLSGLLGSVYAACLLKITWLTLKKNGPFNVVAVLQRLLPLPFGQRFAKFMIGRTVPYSLTTDPFFTKTEYDVIEGLVVQKRALVSPFRSIHAAALFNVAEFFASIIVMSNASELKLKAIPCGGSIRYLKLARGTVRVVAKLDRTLLKAGEDFSCRVDILLGSDEVCTTAEFLFSIKSLGK